MKPIYSSLALATTLLALTGTPAAGQSETFIEYTVTGSAETSGKDVDTILCSSSEDGFNIHSVGEWVISFEAPSAEAGEHDARARVAAPDAVTALHDENFRTDDRLTGDAKLVIERAGTGQMNFPLIRVRFVASGLTSATGATIDIQGTLVCAVI